MFVQIIEGRVSDREGFIRQGERWQAELQPGATGFLGATSGVTADGRAITIARFESEDAARANSDRPEQGGWWAETEKCFDGDVSFTESSDAVEVYGGGSDDAGFVQVMKGSGADRAELERLDAVFETQAREVRPDLLGALRVWTGAGSYVEAAYFTSEAEARAGEQAELPADLQEAMADFEQATGDIEYLDLTEPHLH